MRLLHLTLNTYDPRGVAMCAPNLCPSYLGTLPVNSLPPSSSPATPHTRGLIPQRCWCVVGGIPFCCFCLLPCSRLHPETVMHASSHLFSHTSGIKSTWTIKLESPWLRGEDLLRQSPVLGQHQLLFLASRGSAVNSAVNSELS